MFNFLKRNKEKTPEGQKPLSEKLQVARKGIKDRFFDAILGKKSIDADVLKKLESVLLAADFGQISTDKIMVSLQDRLSRKARSDIAVLREALKEELLQRLKTCSVTDIEWRSETTVLLMIGVNGVGKTTTIGKLTHRYLSQGKKIMLAAGDTFRAGAIEQLKIWGEKHDVPVVAQQQGSDSAAVLFDAVHSALKYSNCDGR